jgi:hypothetical protein
MLLSAPFAITAFSGLTGFEGSSSHPVVRGARQTSSRAPSEDHAMASATMTRGDEVMFERLDVADALGIWRNAKGRVVGIHGQDGRTPTIDVAFDGHEVLQRYLPGLFRRVQ